MGMRPGLEWVDIVGLTCSNIDSSYCSRPSHWLGVQPLPLVGCPSPPIGWVSKPSHWLGVQGHCKDWWQEPLLHSVALSIDVVCFPTLQQGDTPLYWAARNGHLDVVQYLCEEDIAINTKDAVCATRHPPFPLPLPLCYTALCCVSVMPCSALCCVMPCYAMLVLCCVIYVIPCCVNRLVRRRCTSLRGTGTPMCWPSYASQEPSLTFRTTWVRGELLANGELCPVCYAIPELLF